MAYTKNPIMRLGNPQIDPMTGQPMQTTMVPPQMAPMGGGFTPQVQQNIQGMTGSPEMRQYAAGGLNAPLFKKKPAVSITEQDYNDELKRKRRMPGFAEKPEGGVQRAAKENTAKFKKEISAPKASVLNYGSPLNGNAFTAALQSAKESGASTFEVGGKTYNVK